MLFFSSADGKGVAQKKMKDGAEGAQGNERAL